MDWEVRQYLIYEWTKKMVKAFHRGYIFMEMRRSERKMDKKGIAEVLLETPIGNLATTRNGIPYTVPIQFLYEPLDKAIYFHGARKGRKIKNIKANPRVCFNAFQLLGLVCADKACEYDQSFRSVIVFGTASFVEDADKKFEVLKGFMEKYARDSPAPIPVTKSMAASTTIIQLSIEEVSGKQNTEGTIHFPVKES
jgi:hypothetical protein